MALTWSHAVLYVKDTERMLDFYTRVLGFRITDRGLITGRDAEIIFLSQDPGEHHQLALLPMRQDEGPSNSLAHLAFRVGDMAELRDAIATLRAEGVEMRPTSHGNTWSVYFQDPEQNGVEIFRDTPWHVAQPQGKTWDLDADDETLAAWTKAEFGTETTFEPKEAFHSRKASEWG
ncbi:MAG: VOC family protein [Alphaproteobacteria bacterium]|nr:VOC family protein [Alphaproteobacteria bacterium]MCB9931606.1 VOC family protein [Alphaproteobacteria bacterium]